MKRTSSPNLSNLEYHVLLATVSEPLYGYAIKTAIADESDQALTPGAGSLYRVLARLMTQGLMEEAASANDAKPHPGLARKYYALTTLGRQVLATEAGRLRHVATLAAERLGTTGKNAP